MNLLLTSSNPNEKFPVDARELHLQLGSKKDFSSWIKSKIKSGGFVEYEDFEVLTQKGENPKGGRPGKEYMLSINMAKHLCQMEGTAKGKQCREYFIRSEEKLQEIKQGKALPFNQEMIQQIAVTVAEILKQTDVRFSAYKNYHDIAKPRKPIQEYLEKGKFEYVSPYLRKSKLQIMSERNFRIIKALDEIENAIIQPDLFD